MRSKLLKICMILFVCVVSFVTIYGTESTTTLTKDNVAQEEVKNSLISINSYEDIYRLSEEKDPIDLPFFNLFLKSATYDKLVNHSGITYGHSTVDITDKLEGLQVIFSDDMVTIKGEIENAIIYGNNIVVEGKISGDCILMSPSVKITDKAKVKGDVIVVANNLDIEGTVDGNVIATIAEKINVSGTITNKLRMIANSFNLENSKIEGDIYLETDNKESEELTALTKLYPKAEIASITEEKNDESDILDIITKGIITVIVYTAICFFVTKKENNVFTKALNKFKEHTIYGVIFALLYFVLIILVTVALIALGVFGLGIIAWPILIVCIALLLLSISASTFVVGVTIYEAVKNKVNKWKIPSMAVIFALLYALTVIPFISYYAVIAINLISFAIILTMLTKKTKKEN